MFGGTHLVNRAGMARTFQNIRLFREMSVIENLLVAQHTQVNRHLLAGILNTRGYRQAENQALDRALLAGGGGDGGLRQPSGGTSPTDSSGGWRLPAPCAPVRRCCLDEPAAGLNRWKPRR